MKSKKKFEECKEDEQQFESEVAKFSLDNLMKELSSNKELIKLTGGKEEGDGDTSGSDSDPSGDNLEEEDL